MPSNYYEVHKCMLCGYHVLYSEGSDGTPVIRSAEHVRRTINEIKSCAGVHPVPLTISGFHACADGSYGVTTYVGYERIRECDK